MALPALQKVLVGTANFETVIQAELVLTLYEKISKVIDLFPEPTGVKVPLTESPPEADYHLEIHNPSSMKIFSKLFVVVPELVLS